MDHPTTPADGDPPPLQSKDHRGLLDIVDRLRSQGLGRFVDLPQIIVCGDQSSGKSSALEAISGMTFPTKDNLCTRFATELILRRAQTAAVDICIIPGSDRSDAEKERLKAFGHTGTPTDLDIGSVVEDAKTAMGLTGNARVFSSDILRVEISGPSQPHLTMVDLPGLFLAGNKDQSDEDAALVEGLVLSYMKKPRTIILAVVSAKSDFALQQVTRHARALDPKGIRTLGLITKPDTLDSGSDSERFFIELAQNKDVEFRLGWHVLRNRNYAERDSPTAARDAAETEFFLNGIWKSLRATQLGVATLRVRLSNVLRDQILKQLPSVLSDVMTGIDECRGILAGLGAARVTTAEQKRHLLAVSAKFSGLVTAAVDGMYTDGFFRGPCERRLRAVVQNALREFAKVMRTKGHALIITEKRSGDDKNDDGDSDDGAEDRKVSRANYIQEVKILMAESRGRELPGTYNPLIIAELFNKQSKPWRDIVGSFVERVFNHASANIGFILRHVADVETAGALLDSVVNPKMEQIKKALDSKVDEILEPHVSGHPITYNHYLTDNVQKAVADRSRRRITDSVKLFFKPKASYDSERGSVSANFQLQSLVDAILKHTEQDMDTYACSNAVDMMQAYYKVRPSPNTILKFRPID